MISLGIGGWVDALNAQGMRGYKVARGVSASSRLATQGESTSQWDHTI